MHAYLCSSPLTSKATTVYPGAGSFWRGGSGDSRMWEQWQQIEQDCHCSLHVLWQDQRLFATRVWIDRRQMVVLFTRECIVLTKCNELYVSLLYFGAFVQVQVRAYTPKALHCTHLGTVIEILSPASYHSFVLILDLASTFVQTWRKKAWT